MRHTRITPTNLGTETLIGTNGETITLRELPPPKRHNRGTKKKFASREFVAWDGEGITYPGDIQQSYVLLGASTGDRQTARSLSTLDCLELLLEVGERNRDSIHVGFAFQYDVNMILRDLNRTELHRIYHTNHCKWGGFSIQYFPGKWLNVKQGERRIRLYDVFSFFQSSFVVACEKFLGADDPELVGIREGKQARSSFEFHQLDTFIIPYWEAELRLLVRLMDSLRNDLTQAELFVTSWHGPGAVASTTFKKHKIQLAKCETPPEVQRASQFAYAGGRFEQFMCGHYDSRVYEYDINSAYPSAIAELPNLSSGHWEQVDEFEPDSFGIWNVRYVNVPREMFFDPEPVFFRNRHGQVSYPDYVQGWYWTPEASLIPESVSSGYVFRPDPGTDRPFRFVEDMYRIRAEWKQSGNSAERALKLALNSLYGKMAQRKGWETTERAPQWHQLEWAGYVTSHCRAKLYRAMMQSPDTVIALETDAIFSTKPLDLPIGDGLGEWSESAFDWITYVQSGFYFAGEGGSTIERYRGFDRGSISHATILSYLGIRPKDRKGNPNDSVVGLTTRFVGMGSALHTSAVWRSWDTAERVIRVGDGGKRWHSERACPECRENLSMTEALHHLQMRPGGGPSHPHKLPWVEEEISPQRFAIDLEAW